MQDWRKTIVHLMRERGLNMKQLSRLAGRGETFVRDVLDYEKDPRLSNVMALADALGVSVGQLIVGDQPDFQSIPIIGRVAAGEGWNAVNDRLGEIELRVEGGEPVALEVSGDSMKPVYRNGDLLIGAKRAGTTADNLIGLDCIVLTEDGDKYVKFLARGSVRGKFHLRSYNPAQKDVENVKLAWAAPIIWVRRTQR
jgi:SOS-response transcriptional repressor LexA